jgi:hypothetical protein
MPSRIKQSVFKHSNLEDFLFSKKKKDQEMSRLKKNEHRTFIHVRHKLTDFSKTRCTRTNLYFGEESTNLLRHAVDPVLTTAGEEERRRGGGATGRGRAQECTTGRGCVLFSRSGEAQAQRGGA